ncbi:MAG: metallophosphoesterase family protein [Candidatus Omnitrophota bacterium]
MKLGIFSDIHGNMHAFEPIVERLLRENCDTYIYLGDICGYYYDQNEVINRLRQMPRLQAVAGNHDVLFLRSLNNDYLLKDYTGKFGLSFQLLKETITPENLDFLRNLPESVVLENGTIGCFHGSPWHPLEEYVYVDYPMERFDELSYKLVLLGHTHRAIDIRRPNLRVINPGSAGQPRDGKWPTYAVYDTETENLELKRVPFEIDDLIHEIKRRNDPNPYLIRVLNYIKDAY